MSLRIRLPTHRPAAIVGKHRVIASEVSGYPTCAMHRQGCCGYAASSCVKVRYGVIGMVRVVRHRDLVWPVNVRWRADVSPVPGRNCDMMLIRGLEVLAPNPTINVLVLHPVTPAGAATSIFRLPRTPCRPVPTPAAIQ